MRVGREYNDMDHMNKKLLFPLDPLSNIEITNYFNYERRFNSTFSRDNLPKIKDGAYVLNLDDNQSILAGIQLCTLILLELNTFLKKY